MVDNNNNQMISISASILYKKYTSFCSEKGYNPKISNSRFGVKLNSLKNIVVTKNRTGSVYNFNVLNVYKEMCQKDWVPKLEDVALWNKLIEKDSKVKYVPPVIPQLNEMNDIFEEEKESIANIFIENDNFDNVNRNLDSVLDECVNDSDMDNIDSNGSQLKWLLSGVSSSVQSALIFETPKSNRNRNMNSQILTGSIGSINRSKKRPRIHLSYKKSKYESHKKKLKIYR